MKIFDSRPICQGRRAVRRRGVSLPLAAGFKQKTKGIFLGFLLSRLLALINWTNEAERLLASRLKESADVDTRPLQVAYN